MTQVPQTRRAVLAAAAAASALILGPRGLIAPARAQGLAPTETMRGGANNYRAGAPIRDRIGGVPKPILERSFSRFEHSYVLTSL